ncbi:DoxX family protein [Microtetraspora malaysiensis]|uniref:DoxX family protein n=1 Tax=Microtetraspora malaysiensis TaxID=161358 RepID=UPI000A65D00C|nr:DoxX family protein [Microtetraspora malaysiensis]
MAHTRETTVTATTMSAATTATSRRSRIRTALSRVVRLALALQFASGGVLKLFGAAQMTAMFAEIGAGQWLRIVVGALELAGAAGLLLPRPARAAAAGLVALMIGATVTNVTVLGTSPALPLFLLTLAAAVAVMRRGHR